MNRKAIIKKIMFLLIVTIIPLIAAFLIGLYSYNRYQSEYNYNYMNNIEEVTESKIEGYLKLITHSYEEEKVYSETIKHDGDTVFKIDIFRGVVSKVDVDTEEEYLQLQYYVAIYDVDYDKLIEIEDPTGEKKLLYNNIPLIYIKIVDKNNSENEFTDSMKTTPSEYLIDDYNSSPEEDYRGNPLNSRFVRWLEIIPSSDFSNEVEVELFLTDTLDNDERTYYSVITTFELDNYETDVDDVNVDSFIDGYNNDPLEAGYFGYILKTKIWWQSLIAFALVGLITFSFYAVWNYEEKLRKENIKKK